MVENAGRDRDQERVATTDEVRNAINSLSLADLAKLKKFDETLTEKIRRRVWGVGAGDLLQEAIISVLEAGHRNWKPNQVDLMGFLMGAMRSIASNWSRKGRKTEPPPRLDSDLVSVNEDGDQIPTALEAALDGRPNPEQFLLMSELPSEEALVAELENLVRDDLVASLVMEGWKNGMKGPEIRDSLDLTQKEHEAAVKRIRRKRDARWPKGLPYVQ
jgi:DNA-directed RNA polymerase specialized sigma24 family protein